VKKCSVSFEFTIDFRELVPDHRKSNAEYAQERTVAVKPTTTPGQDPASSQG
jgi:hypothetical protein